MSDYHSRKITLPGGREIEVVYLGEVPAEAVGTGGWAEVPDAEVGEMLGAAFTAFDRLSSELWMCEGCGSDLVRPLAIEAIDDGIWYVERECPECGTRDVGGFTREEVEEYRDALEDGQDELVTALGQLARMNMEDDVARMVEAINDGLIQPMDF
jgi:hypothetical protein